MYLLPYPQDFCKTLANKRFYVYFINEESKVEDTLLLDYSQLLMFKGEDAQPVVQNLIFLVYFYQSNH